MMKFKGLRVEGLKVNDFEKVNLQLATFYF